RGIEPRVQFEGQGSDLDQGIVDGDLQVFRQCPQPPHRLRYVRLERDVEVRYLLERPGGEPGRDLFDARELVGATRRWAARRQRLGIGGGWWPGLGAARSGSGRWGGRDGRWRCSSLLVLLAHGQHVRFGDPAEGAGTAAAQAG